LGRNRGKRSHVEIAVGRARGGAEGVGKTGQLVQADYER